MDLADEKGATAVEYALLASAIAAVVAVVVIALGSRLEVIFQNVVSSWP